jgi:NAD(P)-dependent dehydrogenase (short-subunit alcohol dehydrogenase family)
LIVHCYIEKRIEMKNRWTIDNIPDQKGRTVIVTGANSGIGYEAARALAGKNAKTIMACRNIAKGEEAASEIRSEYTSAMVEVMDLDLGNLDSVRRFANTFKKTNKRLDLLINNAGVMMPPYGKTSDGFELQFGINHLGHFALTGLLLPLLIKTGGSRIVTVSSTAHKAGRMNFDDLQSEQSYKKMAAYGQSKLSNLLFTYELQRRFESAGVSSIATAAHPGWTTTNLQRHVGGARFLNPLFGQKQDMGALPTLRAAIDEDARGSDYFGPSGLYEMQGYPVKVKSNGHSHNTDNARKLWDVSEKLTGVTFDI